MPRRSLSSLCKPQPESGYYPLVQHNADPELHRNSQASRQFLSSIQQGWKFVEKPHPGSKPWCQADASSKILRNALGRTLGLFHDVLEFICLTLEELDELRIKSDGIQPNSLLASIQTAQFIIALVVMKPVFSLTKNLSQNLQKEDCHLSECVQMSK